MSSPKAVPQEPPPPHTAQIVASDAGVPDPLPPPELGCEPGTALAVAPAPEPTWFCAKPDGTRHGPFVTVFPDGQPEITGAYQDGVLHGPWQRRGVTGAIVEAGTYEAGLKSGRWQMTSAAGTLLGEYDMRAGTGTEKHWLDSGRLYSERTLKAGVADGPEKIYAADGTPLVASHWTDGKLDGPHTAGTRSALRIEESFAAGKRRGSRQIWQYRWMLSEASYDRRGELDGEYTTWRSKNVIRVHGQYRHGKRKGLWTWNDRDDHKEREGKYAGGKRHGRWTEWRDNKIVFTGHYTRGKPNGEFTYYDGKHKVLGRFKIKNGTGTMLTFWPNKKVASRKKLYRGKRHGPYQELTPRGELIVEGEFRNDLKDGPWREWTPDGVPTLEQTWKAGKLDGVVKKYVAGQVAMEATYQDGKAHGRYVEYRAGKPWVIGQFQDDRKTGTWTEYDADDRVTLTATYQDGVLDGPWRQRVGGVVLEGTMTLGRRTGTWTRTDKAGAVRELTYPPP